MTSLVGVRTPDLARNLSLANWEYFGTELTSAATLNSSPITESWFLPNMSKFLLLFSDVVAFKV